MSVAPPGGKGTMKRTGRCGHSCAATPMDATESNTTERNLNSLIPGLLLKFILQRQCERKPDRQRETRGARGQRLLPPGPGQELERQHAQPAGEVRGEGEHDGPFGELH